MSKPKFKAGDKVTTDYWADKPGLRLTVLHHLPHPEEYQGVMPELYEMSDGSVLKEHYLKEVS